MVRFKHLVAAAIVGAGVLASAGMAQDALVVTPPATTVQLPTFNFFTISTTVLVPDRGGMHLGGVNSAGSTSRSNGGPVFANRGGGSNLGASGISIHVQVHDFAAMDQALLAKAARDVDPTQTWTTRVEQARQSTAGRPAISVADARRLRDAAPTEQR